MASYRISQDIASARQQLYIDNLVTLVSVRSQQSFVERLDLTDIDYMIQYNTVH